MSDVVLQAVGIHKSFRNGSVVTPVLHGIDLSVRQGEFLVIMGPSGCGKSTLLHILGLMMAPTRAESLKIDARETLGLSDGARTRLRRDTIGFVFQRFNLLPELSAEGNVQLALQLAGQSVDERIDPLFERVGLTDSRPLKPGQLSIGQQQRVAILRAVATRPAILLADEPTGNLDSANARRVLDLLRGFRNDNGQTIVMITHNPQCADWADRVLQMSDGRIEA